MELFGTQFEKIQDGPFYDGGSPINWALYSLFNHGIQISRPSATYEIDSSIHQPQKEVEVGLLCP